MGQSFRTSALALSAPLLSRTAFVWVAAPVSRGDILRPAPAEATYLT